MSKQPSGISNATVRIRLPCVSFPWTKPVLGVRASLIRYHGNGCNAFAGIKKTHLPFWDLFTCACVLIVSSWTSLPCAHLAAVEHGKEFLDDIIGVCFSQGEHVPNINFIVLYVEQQQENHIPCNHSNNLSVVFGFITHYLGQHVRLNDAGHASGRGGATPYGMATAFWQRILNLICFYFSIPCV
eukprot:Gb_10487 [translate_table: standard]